MNYLNDKQSNQALNLLGLSTQQLIVVFALGAILLLLLFSFIYLGIAALSNGGTFSSIINSMLPIGFFFLCNNFHVGAGTAVSKNKKKKTSTEEENEKVEEVMDEVAEIVGEEES